VTGLDVRTHGRRAAGRPVVTASRTRTGAPETASPPAWREVMHAVLLGLSTGVIVLVAALAVVLIVIPKVTGSVPLSVLTQSMEPSLPPGTLLVVRPVPVDDIRVGDVVTYQIASGQPAVVSHRVVGITTSSTGQRTFVLKGDANDLPDSAPVTAPQIRGVLWYSLPGLGVVNQAVNGSRSWLVPTMAGILLTYGVLMVGMGTRSAVQRRRRRAARGGRAHRVAQDDRDSASSSAG
jgi:signal peptidase